jgi:hypothetical protein
VTGVSHGSVTLNGTPGCSSSLNRKTPPTVNRTKATIPSLSLPLYSATMRADVLDLHGRAAAVQVHPVRQRAAGEHRTGQ